MLTDELNTINNLFYSNSNAINGYISKGNELITLFKNKSLKKFKQKDIEKYFNYLKQHNNSNATINAKLAYLSKCLKYNKNPLILPFQKVQNKTKSIITYDEYLKLLDKVTGNNDLLQFIALAYYTGLRSQEILNIKQQHLIYNIEDNSYCINIYNTKNHKDNLIPATKKLNVILQNFEEFTINYKQLYYELKKLNITAHQFRHSFITRCFETGLDTFTVMKLVNQSSIQSTQKYVHLQNKFLNTKIQAL